MERVKTADTYLRNISSDKANQKWKRAEEKNSHEDIAFSYYANLIQTGERETCKLKAMGLD